MPTLELFVRPPLRFIPPDGNLVLNPSVPGLNRVLIRELSCVLRVPPISGAYHAILDTGAPLTIFPHDLWYHRFGWRAGRDFDELSVAGLGSALTGQVLGYRYAFRLARLRVSVELAGRDPKGDRLRLDSLVCQLADASGPPFVLLGLWGGAVYRTPAGSRITAELGRHSRDAGILTPGSVFTLWTSDTRRFTLPICGGTRTRPTSPPRGTGMNRTSPAAGPHPDHTDSGSLSHCDVSLLQGNSVTFWACPKTDVAVRTTVNDRPGAFTELALCLAPERLVVVGRASPQHTVPYLDPAYRSTTMLPDTRQSVLRGDDHTDYWVSRAHFTLRGAADGAVVFTNGVPRTGGGVRPPMNGTWLVAPAVRFLDPGEEVRIGCGEAVAIRLPNHCVLQLKAR